MVGGLKLSSKTHIIINTAVCFIDIMTSTPIITHFYPFPMVLFYFSRSENIVKLKIKNDERTQIK